MKKRTLTTFSTLLLSLTCSSVFAVDGSITVNGVITDQTCTLQPRLGPGTGIKDIIIPLNTVSKSSFTPTNTTQGVINFFLFLRNAMGDECDTATTKAFKGIHLSAISPTDDLDVDDKTLLVNKAKGTGGASTSNPIFIQMFNEYDETIDFSAPWGTQARGLVYGGEERNRHVYYRVGYVSKTGIVDAQNVTATVNYTIHYN